MRKTLIFDTSIDGHHLEYIHHLYEAKENEGTELVFCIPQAFEKVKENFQWSDKANINYHFLDDEQCKSIQRLGRVKYAIATSKLLLKVCKEEQPDKVFLISILQLLPFLPLFFIGRKEKISGILYKIYLYSWKQYSLVEKIYESLRFLSVRLSANIKHIFVLNDEAAARRMNIVWRCAKFIPLPDPFQSKSGNTVFEKPLLPSNKIKVLHFGGMARRKGTIEIIKAIQILCADGKVQRYQFVFAGKINSDIRDEFYEYYYRLKEKCDILVMDRFCSYDELDELCRECDIILAPYQNVHSSSGVIAYAAKFHKPVIVPDDGLLGKLVRKYKLGLAVNNLNSAKIYELLASDINIQTNVLLEDKYIANNSIDNFTNSIFSHI